jgi:multiple sugar transport system ATP-binding protein
VIRVPALWLLDEPMAHLDAAQRVELRHWLVREVRRTGVTTLYVTHDPTEALAVGDRVAVLDGGRLLQIGTPAELYRRPGSVFVADFASSSGAGVLPARMISSGGLAGYTVGDRVLACWTRVPPELEGHVGRPVLLLLRPEDVHDAAGQDDPDLSRLDTLVVRTEFTGREVSVTLDVDGATLLARFDRSSPVRAGEPITVALDAARAHVFDPATGHALWHPPDP